MIKFVQIAIYKSQIVGKNVLSRKVKKSFLKNSWIRIRKRMKCKISSVLHCQ